jgi:hypothetical protein
VRIAAIAKNLPPGERENFLLQEFLGARKYFQSTIRKQFFELLQDPPHPDFLLAGLDTLSSNKKLTENDEIFLLEILFLNISRHGALDPAWSKKLSDLCTLKLSESRSNEVRALALLCLGVSAPDLFAATTQSGVFVDNAKLQEALLGRYRLYPHQIPKSCRLPEPVVLTLAQSDQDTIKQNIFSYVAESAPHLLKEHGSEWLEQNLQNPKILKTLIETLQLVQRGAFEDMSVPRLTWIRKLNKIYEKAEQNPQLAALAMSLSRELMFNADLEKVRVLYRVELAHAKTLAEKSVLLRLIAYLPPKHHGQVFESLLRSTDPELRVQAVHDLNDSHFSDDKMALSQLVSIVTSATWSNLWKRGLREVLSGRKL